MKFLLDTNMCIGWLRQSQPNIIARMKQASPDDLAICSVVVAELIYGIERSPQQYQSDNRKKVGQLRNRITSVPFDDFAAEACGRIGAYLAERGIPIGPNDLLIASIAVANDVTLVTHNTSEFSRVPGLHLEDRQ